MPSWNCDLCNYSTKFKADFTKHTKTKKHHKKLIEKKQPSKEYGVMNTNEHKKSTNEHRMNTNEHGKSTKKSTNEHKKSTNEHEFKCEFCESIFKSQASKRRHEKHYCKDNPAFVEKVIYAKNSKIKILEKDFNKLKKDQEVLKTVKDSLQKDKEKLEKEKEVLYKQVSTLLEKVGNTTNIQNNIILNNYGKEDLSHITDSLKDQLLKVPYGAIPKMIEAIHFNDEKPENKNIMIPNKKENLVKIFQGDKWIYKNKNETITDLVDSKYTIIDEHYEESNNISTAVKTSFNQFRKFYEDRDAEMVENLKKECELVLLNNR